MLLVEYLGNAVFLDAFYNPPVKNIAWAIAGVQLSAKEVRIMKRYSIPRVAHCSNGCQLQSWVRRETARSPRMNFLDTLDAFAYIPIL